MECVPIDLQRIVKGYYATIHDSKIRVWNVHASAVASKRAPRELTGSYRLPEKKGGGSSWCFTFPRYLANGCITISKEDLMIHCLCVLKQKGSADWDIQLKIEKQIKRQDAQFKSEFEPTVLHNNFTYRIAEIYEEKVYFMTENKYTLLEDAEKAAERQAITSGKPRSIIAIVGTVFNKVERKNNLIWT